MTEGVKSFCDVRDNWIPNFLDVIDCGCKRAIVPCDESLKPLHSILHFQLRKFED